MPAAAQTDPDQLPPEEVAPEPEQPAPPSASGAIASITIQCDLPRCGDPDEMARLLSLTDLRVSKGYRDQDARAAEYYLAETGLFLPASVRAVATQVAGQVDVLIETEGATLIREVHIEAGLSLERDIEQRVFMRSGEVYEPERNQQQIDSIRSVFEQDGYYEARVDLLTVEIEPYLVDLHIVIDKGQRLDVRDVYLRGRGAYSYDELAGDLLGGFGFFRTFSEDNFDEGVEAMLERYREGGYLRARVITREFVPRPEVGAADLFVEIREGPRFSFEFSGNRHFDDEELLEALDFASVGFLDEPAVAASTAELAALYQTAGYLFANVGVRQEWLDTNEVRVRYAIFEGTQAEIREIAFDGNANATADELQELMATRVYGVLESGGYLQPEQLEGDIRTIEAYYHELGYLSAFVPRWVVVAEDGGASLFIRIFVDEGPRTTVSDVTFHGNTLISSGGLRRSVTLRPGDPISLARVHADAAAVRNRFLAIGQQARRVEAVCLAGEEEVPCAAPAFPSECMEPPSGACSEQRRGDRIVRECTRLAESFGCQPSAGIQQASIAIEYRVTEGSLVTVGEIFVIGNFLTDDDVIRDVLPFEAGDPYNFNALVEGQSSLRQLGIFSSVRVVSIGVSDDAHYPRDEAGIVIQVEEAQAEFIEYRLGVASQSSADSDLRVVLDNDLGYIHQNPFGRAVQLQLIGSFDFDLVGAARVTDGEFAASAAIVFADRRFDWFNLVEDPWEAQTSLSYSYDLLSDALHERILLGEALIRQEFADVAGLFFSLSLAIKRAESKTPAEEVFEDRLILRLSPSLILDRRDNPLIPSSGYRAELTVDLADKFFGAGLDVEEFTRIRVSGSYLVPLGRRFVLVSWLRFGFALGGVFSGFTLDDPASDDPEDALVLPDTERFRLGGLSGVRGFPDDSLGPTGVTGEALFGDVVLNGSLELRFPLVPAIDLFGATFLDAGQLVADFDDLQGDGFRYSAGLGVRWLAFGLVPVVLDYGMILDRRVGERIGQLQFNVGYSF